jgi:YVTN family beta-propeller protein
MNHRRTLTSQPFISCSFGSNKTSVPIWFARLAFFLASLTVLASAFAADRPDPRSQGLLLVCNKGDKALGLIDPAARKQIATIAEDGTTGHEVAASPDGNLAFVPIYGNAGVGSPGTDGQLVRIMDLASRAIVATVDLGKGLRPHCAVVGPKNGLLYVTTEIGNSVTVIDPKTRKVLYEVPTGQPESHMLAITRDGRRGYTSNVGPGTVSVLDLETRKVIATIPVAPHAQRISLSVDDRWVFTSDQTKPELVVIDTASNQVARRIELPGKGYGTAPTPDGCSLVVAVPNANKVAIVDLGTMTVTHTFDLPKAPQEVLVRPDGAVAYVSCDASAQVAEIDLKSWKVAQLINAGAGADGLAWAPATEAR